MREGIRCVRRNLKRWLKEWKISLEQFSTKFGQKFFLFYLSTFHFTLMTFTILIHLLYFGSVLWSVSHWSKSLVKIKKGPDHLGECKCRGSKRTENIFIRSLLGFGFFPLLYTTWIHHIFCSYPFLLHFFSVKRGIGILCKCALCSIVSNVCL